MDESEERKVSSPEPAPPMSERLTGWTFLFGLFIAAIVIDTMGWALIHVGVPRAYGIRDATMSISTATYVICILLFASSRANRAVVRSHRPLVALGAIVVGVAASIFALSGAAQLTDSQSLKDVYFWSSESGPFKFNSGGFKLALWNFLDAVPVLALPDVFNLTKPDRPDDPPTAFAISLALARLTAAVALVGSVKAIWDSLHKEADADDAAEKLGEDDGEEGEGYAEEADDA